MKSISQALKISSTICILFVSVISAAHSQNLPPACVSVSPISGKSDIGQEVVFTATYQDPNGYQNIEYAELFIGGPSGAVVYLRCAETYNLLYMRSDDLTRWTGYKRPGSNSIMENRYAVVDCSKCKFTGSGTTLTVTWAVTFKETMRGETLTVSMLARDDTGLFSNWVTKGTWAAGNNSPPSVGDITPISNGSFSGQEVIFTTTFSDPDGYEKIEYVEFLVRTSNKAAYFRFSKRYNLLYIRSDDGAHWTGYKHPGTGYTIENSCARLNCARTSLTGSGKDLTVKWAITFKDPFVGARPEVLLFAKDNSGEYSGWTRKGTWTIGANQPPVAGTITPINGSSAPDEEIIFTSTFSDPNRYWNIDYVELYISGASGKTVHLRYSQNYDMIYIRSDDGSRWTGYQRPGAPAFIENSYAKLNCSKTTVTGSGNTMTVKWALTFKDTFMEGAHNVVLAARDYYGAGSGWVSKGNWRVGNMPMAPSVVNCNGYRLMVRKRQADGSLGAPQAYLMKGVAWSPSGIGTPGPEVNEENMRLQHGVWCDTDLPLIQGMNANTIRTFMDFGLSDNYSEKNWQYILDQCYKKGIMVVLTVDRNIGDLTRVQQVVNKYKNHPAILMWLISNEWNINNMYGNVTDLNAAAARVQQAAQLIKTLDTNHPVASCLGEPNVPTFADIENIVINTCSAVDVWSFNLYRGRTLGGIFSQWDSLSSRAEKDKPMFISEFGSDAYDVNTNLEDQTGQRTYEYFQWRNIRDNLSSSDPAKTCIGGCVFEFNDEWWKVKGASATIHDTAGWYTMSCPDGHASEEWWGLVDINRKPRQSYQLFKEFFGGIEPEAPAAADGSFNVVRFSTQPDYIMTNIQTYPVMDVFEGAVEIKVNGEIVDIDAYKGFKKDIALIQGANQINVEVKYADNCTAAYQNTVVYNPSYSTAGEKLLYYQSIVIDLDTGAVIGTLPIFVVSITNDAQFIVGADKKVYFTSNHLYTGKQLNFTNDINADQNNYPLFSRTDRIIYFRNEALNFDSNSVISSNLYYSIGSRNGMTSYDNYLWYGDYSSNSFKKLDPNTHSVVLEIPNLNLIGYYLAISGNGRLAFQSNYGWASGHFYFNDMTAEGAETTISGLSDYTGNIIPSYDDAKVFLGSFGNSYYGKGGVYVINQNTKQVDSFYQQYGAQQIGLSPDNIFATSACKDHFGDGYLIQGNPYHRGIEVLKLQGLELKYEKSYFLALDSDYNPPGKILYKKNR